MTDSQNETIPGGKYLAPDGETYIDAWGNPIEVQDAEPTPEEVTDAAPAPVSKASARKSEK